ncbi:hypothetical protein F444_05374 [Phytophthora nicotianae P1976]|uniref:Uncharacterized protein n=3 Tax=Phytophthora nicotianae TaxID=4792 RepID=A0A081AMA4_PHYNI|nr:hypothetical protein F444_05374 [Phytophthora nicotianae P1976]
MLELKERKIEACREECEAERRERVRERAYDREEQAHIRTEDGKRVLKLLEISLARWRATRALLAKTSLGATPLLPRAVEHEVDELYVPAILMLSALARRSLKEELNPEDIQLAQDSPQYASPAANTASHGPVRSPPTMQSPHLPQTTSGRERTPPMRRSPWLAGAAGVSNDTPPRATASRVVPSSLDEGELTSLVQRRTHDDNSSSIEGHTNADANLYRLIVKPIVKQAVSQRDQTGQSCNADTGEWSIAELDIKEWAAMMQLKLPSRHLVDNDKTEHQWNLWLSSIGAGKVALLYVYEYGSTIKTFPMLASFKRACIDPVATDRAGAASDVTLQEFAHRVAIEQPPPGVVARLFRLAEASLEQQISGISRSANLALYCVNAAIAANNQLLQDWESFGARITENGKCLVARKDVIQSFIDDVLLPRDGADPMERMENIPDVDHV